MIRILEPTFRKAPKIDATTAQIYEKEAYLINFGISSDGALDQRPLGLVAMYDAEDPTVCSRYGEHLKKFAELSIGETYKISIKEFLRQPRHRVEMMYEAAEAWQKKKAAAASAADQTLEQQMAAAGIRIPPR